MKKLKFIWIKKNSGMTILAKHPLLKMHVGSEAIPGNPEFPYFLYYHQTKILKKFRTEREACEYAEILLREFIEFLKDSLEGEKEDE